ncbi:Hypothetical predicted protein [Octopus vulgaris]|uniref:Uncharacterized protein n=4 Tax=Octopus TaxID=6643 RepID=A0AA36BP90_OCTVU|nr:uncharacterized protein LOC115222307 isoform X1 [Octopus sinensis]CAI9737096.1 Hypothetical predicted protein [Octopus vulgaris]
MVLKRQVDNLFTGNMASEQPTLANFHLFEGDFAVVGVNEFRKEWRQIAKGNMRHNTFLEGMLLKSVEARPLFPYIDYAVLDCPDQPVDLNNYFPNYEIVGGQRRVIEPVKTSNGIRADPYCQVDCVGRHGIADLPKRPMNTSTTYFFSAFQTEGNLSTLERTWRSWSGADYLLWKCPDELKLNRITLYKKVHQDTKFTFLVLCECSEGLSHIHKAKDFLERLKERRCGYVSLYRVDRFY